MQSPEERDKPGWRDERVYKQEKAGWRRDSYRKVCGGIGGGRGRVKRGAVPGTPLRGSALTRGTG